MRPYLDSGSAAYAQNLYETYAWYRENDPVHEEAILDQIGVSLFKYDDVCAALSDQRIRSAVVADELIAALEASGEQSLAQLAREGGILINLDDPDHKRIRQVIQEPVRAAMGVQLSNDIATIADDLLSRIKTGEVVDLVAKYAVPLSMMTISKLIGLPVGDYQKLKRWTDEFAAIFDTSQMMGGLARAGRALLEFQEYLNPVVQARRLEPRDDVITALAVARYEMQSISDTELVTNCLFVLLAGNVTTRHLIGNAVHALLSHPDQFEKLRNEPKLMSSAVNEILRFDPPIQSVARVAADHLRIRDTKIRKGTRVRMVLGSANRDPDRFEEPDKLNIVRQNDRHLGFGGGIHFCLGTHLGQLECKIALTALMERFDNLSFATDNREWLPGHKARGLTALPLFLH